MTAEEVDVVVAEVLPVVVEVHHEDVEVLEHEEVQRPLLYVSQTELHLRL